MKIFNGDQRMGERWIIFKNLPWIAYSLLGNHLPLYKFFFRKLRNVLKYNLIHSTVQNTYIAI